MKKIKILLFLGVIFMMTGCYNYRELNQLAITSAIGIDKKGDEYEVSIQVMNTQKQGSDSNSSGDQPKFITYKEKGKTIQQAFRNIVLEAPRRLYANHISLLIINEDVAKEGIYDILDLLFRDSESRKQFNVIISRNSKSYDVLEILTPLETLNAKNINDSLIADSQFLGVSETITFEQLLASYLNEKNDIVLPSVEVIGDIKQGESTENIQSASPSTKVILSGYSIFKGDKLIGYLSNQDSINLGFIRNKIENTIVNYKCDDKNYMNDKIDKQIEKQIKSTIEKINREYNADVYGFEDLFYKKNPKYYKQLKKEYKEDFLSNINIKVESDINLFSKGNLLKVIERGK